MKKIKLKLLCIIGSIFTLIGGILFGVGFLSANCDFNNLTHLTTQEQSYTVGKEKQINAVTISYGPGSAADVYVHFSDTAEEISVNYTLLKTKKGKTIGNVIVTDTDGRLKITETKNWKDYVNEVTFFGWTKDIDVTVTLPVNQSYALDIQTDTGDIVFSGSACSLTSLQLTTDTGDINLQNVDIDCDTAGTLKTDTGDIKIGNLTAKNLSASMDTGDCYVYGTIVSESIHAETDTGDIETRDNGVLDAKEITLLADTGDIAVKLMGKFTDYTVFVETDTGDCNIHNQVGGEKILNAKTDTGDIFVTFTEE